jgi:hypothetical protein
MVPAQLGPFLFLLSRKHNDLQKRVKVESLMFKV